MWRLILACAVLSLTACDKKEIKQSEKSPPPPNEAAKQENAPPKYLLIYKEDEAWIAINSRIDTVNGLKRVWWATLDNSRNGGIVDSLSEYDCSNRTERTLQTTTYSADGAAKKWDVTKDPTWSYPPPSTIAGEVMSYACGLSKSIDVKGTFEGLKSMRAAMMKEADAPKN